MIHLDTHVLVWLSGEEQERVPRAARERLEHEQVSCSPMAQLELAYLYEIGRIRRNANDVLAVLTPSLGLTLSPAPLAAVIAHALDLTWTRDPFDRLIAANALVDGAGLLTADDTILAHCPAAFWDGYKA